MSDIISLAETIVPINRENGKLSVNARDLHAFLEVGKDFSTWVKDRINQFGFVDGLDFEKMENLSSPISGSAKARPQTATDYLLSLDMAKELSMVERTERGKQARQYFIACERKLIESRDPMKSLSDPATMRGFLLEYAERVIALEATVSELEPQAAALARISKADGEMCISNAAKVLQIRPKDLFQWLQSNSWIFRRGAEWLPYSAREIQGVLDCKVTTVHRADGSERACSQTLVTAKGLAKLAEIFEREATA